MNTFLVCLICTLISFLPLIELKGAIPFAMSNIWGESALSPWLAYLVCSIGGILSCFFIPFLFIFLKKKLSKVKFFKKVFLKIDKFILSWLSENEKDHQLISEKKKIRLVFFFCAIPLPLTGVWSAGALCSALNLNYPKSVAVLTLANLTSAGFVALLCFLFDEFVDIILCVMLIIFVLQIVYKTIYVIVEKMIRKRL